jgi:hypothetical protein
VKEKLNPATTTGKPDAEPATFSMNRRIPGGRQRGTQPRMSDALDLRDAHVQLVAAASPWLLHSMQGSTHAMAAAFA